MITYNDIAFTIDFLRDYKQAQIIENIETWLSYYSGIGADKICIVDGMHGAYTGTCFVANIVDRACIKTYFFEPDYEFFLDSLESFFRLIEEVSGGKFEIDFDYDIYISEVAQ